MMMNWDTIQQLLRIILHWATGLLVGSGIITGEMQTTLIGSILGLANIVWWILWERHRKTIAPNV